MIFQYISEVSANVELRMISARWCQFSKESCVPSLNYKQKFTYLPPRPGMNPVLIADVNVVDDEEDADATTADDDVPGNVDSRMICIYCLFTMTV